MAPETRRRAQEARESEAALPLPPPQRRRLTRAGSRAEAPTPARSDMKLERMTKACAPEPAPPSLPRPRLTRSASRAKAPASGRFDMKFERRTRAAAEACASETVLQSPQRLGLTRGVIRRKVPASGRSDMSGNDPATASSSQRTNMDSVLATYTDAQLECTSTGHDESGAATNPEDATDRDEGTGQGDKAARQPKRQRRRNKLGTSRIVINRVSEAGLPVSPKKAEQGYRNALGCILRETVSINETNLRSKVNENLRALLISKLHTQYKFPDESLDETTPVNNRALCKWSKLLSSWKSMAKKEHLKKDYETEIKKIWPSVSEEDWNLFKQHCETPEVKEMEKWGKDMRARNIRKHNLGSRGYPGKLPKWDKQDAELSVSPSSIHPHRLSPNRGPAMAPETRRAREVRVSESALPSPPPQRPRLTRTGSRVEAPTGGRSDMKLESRTRVTEAYPLETTPPPSPLRPRLTRAASRAEVPSSGRFDMELERMTRAAEACASETVLPSLQRLRLTHGGIRGEAPASGRSDMSGNDPATASSSQRTNTDNSWATYTDAQEDYTSTGHGDSGTVTNPEDATDRDEGTSQGDQAAGQPKRQRKPRRPNKLGTSRIVINRVSEAGLPVSPKKSEQGYSNTLGCILRETVSINETNLRSKANENLRALLISKLHTQYKFPDESLDEVTTVNNRALRKWSRLLSSWKSLAKNNLQKDYETEIKKMWPSISEEDWNLFKQHCETPEFKEKEKWGKDMRARNIGNHNLGSRGYLGKIPKWEKQDAELAAAGIPNPFKEFKNPRENYYIRSRSKYDEETKTWVLDEKTAKVKELLRQYHVESQSSQELESSARWDDPLNRSINVVLGKDPKTRPSFGRVNGAGLEKWETHYPEDRELARQRRRASRATKLAEMREELREEMREEVEVKAKAMAKAQVMEMWPELIEVVKLSLASGQTAAVAPPAATLAPANVILEKEPQPDAPHSNPSFMG